MSKGLMFYRCQLCHGVVNHWDIHESGSCPRCGHRRVSPSTLSLWEKVVQVFKHPRFWEWKDV